MAEDYVTKAECSNTSNKLVYALNSLEKEVSEFNDKFSETLYGKEEAGIITGGLVHLVRENNEHLKTINGDLKQIKNGQVENKRTRTQIVIEIIKIIGLIAVALIGALQLAG